MVEGGYIQYIKSKHWNGMIGRKSMWYFATITTAGAVTMFRYNTIDILRRKWTCVLHTRIKKIFWGLQCEMVTLMALLTISIASTSSMILLCLLSHFLCFIFFLVFMHTQDTAEANAMANSLSVSILTIYDACVRVSQRVSLHIKAAFLSMGQKILLLFCVFCCLVSLLRAITTHAHRTHTHTIPHQYKMSTLNLSHRRKNR